MAWIATVTHDGGTGNNDRICEDQTLPTQTDCIDGVVQAISRLDGSYIESQQRTIPEKKRFLRIGPAILKRVHFGVADRSFHLNFAILERKHRDPAGVTSSSLLR